MRSTPAGTVRLATPAMYNVANPSAQRSKDTLSEAVQRYTNPKVIGPGMWIDIHTMARNVKDWHDKKAFEKHMQRLRTTFPCSTCRQHLNEYMDTHPLQPYWTKLDPQTGKDIGLFEWTYLFHNAVSTRLGKPHMDWDTAKALYDPDSDVCSAECQDAH